MAVNIFAESPVASLEAFDKYESEVRSYIRSFPTVFHKAKGHRIWDVEGNEYIDFFAGAGALNYGHNPSAFVEALVRYIQEDGITHGLDMGTKAKAAFLQTFHDVILEPRKLDYKVMFPGPTGTNSVESALKLARKVTGRSTIISFTNAFHGMTLGSLAVTGNRFKRGGAGVPLTNTRSIPYDNYLSGDLDSISLFEQYLDDDGSGMERPAAVIVETVQGEGGINVSRFEWLRRLEAVCREHEILLIIDDVQMGCGRTGPFFSFEPAGIHPDIVCLSKSISGSGLPMALTLLRPELDCWDPGEHNGTFRGNNYAFVTATAALETYWQDDKLQQATQQNADFLQGYLSDLVQSVPEMKATVRGRGMAYGIECGISGKAEEVAAEAFRRGLIIETSGAESQVVKFLAPLTIPQDEFRKGLGILADSFLKCSKA